MVSSLTGLQQPRLPPQGLDLDLVFFQRPLGLLLRVGRPLQPDPDSLGLPLPFLLRLGASLLRLRFLGPNSIENF